MVDKKPKKRLTEKQLQELKTKGTKEGKSLFDKLLGAAAKPKKTKK